MTHQDVIEMRRGVLKNVIEAEGGAYIRPHETHQPQAHLRIASIRARGIVGIGKIEAQAQADWVRQAADQASQERAQ